MKHYKVIQADWRYGQIEIPERDEFIGKSIEIYGEWAQNEIEFVQKLIELNDCRNVVVAGANIGVQSIAFARAMQQWGTVYSFEVHPAIFEIFSRNIELSGVSNIEAHPLGLWSEKGKISIPEFPDEEQINFGGFSIGPDLLAPAQGKAYQAELTTLDHFGLGGCDLLFMDVEGAELKAIEGAEETIKRDQPLIYSEVRNLEEAVPFFRALTHMGYRLYLFSPLAYNENNFRENRINIFGPARETAIFAHPESRPVQIPETYLASGLLEELKGYKGLLECMLRSPYYSSKIHWADADEPFNEEKTLINYLDTEVSDQELRFDLASAGAVNRIRLDICDRPGLVRLNRIRVTHKQRDTPVTLLDLDSPEKIKAFCQTKDILFLNKQEEGISLLFSSEAHLQLHFAEPLPPGDLRIDMNLSWPAAYRKFRLSQKGVRLENDQQFYDGLHPKKQSLDKLLERTSDIKKVLEDRIASESAQSQKLLRKTDEIIRINQELPGKLEEQHQNLSLTFSSSFQNLKEKNDELLQKVFASQENQTAVLDALTYLKEGLPKADHQITLQENTHRSLEELHNRLAMLKHESDKQTRELQELKTLLRKKNLFQKAISGIKHFLGKIFPFSGKFMEYWQIRKQTKLIKNSRYFDKAYYSLKNPDVLAHQIDPARHFLLHGGFEGRNPSESFDTQYYLTQYPDVAKSGMNPLVHYLLHGIRENRQLKKVNELEGQIKWVEEGKPEGRSEILQMPKARPRTITEPAEAIEKADFHPAELKRVYEQAFHPEGLLFRSLADQIKASLRFPRFALAFSHDNYLQSVGGIQLYLQDEEKRLLDQEVSYLQMYPTYNRPHKMYPYFEDFEISIQADGHEIGSFRAKDVAQAMDELLSAEYSCSSIHLHHFMSWNFKVVEYFIDKIREAPKFFYVHDYFTVCPQYNLLFNDKTYCHAPALDSNACTICKYGPDRTIYYSLFQQFFGQYDFQVIAPSEAARNIWQSHFPIEQDRIKLIPHLNIREKKVTAGAETSRPDKKKYLNIAFLGHENYRKGWRVWRHLIDNRILPKKFRPFHLGTRISGKFPEKFVPVTVNKNDRQAMENLLTENEIDIVLLWSIWPETYSYTLYESMAAGCFIITCKDSGNIADQVLKQDLGLVLESEAALFDLFSEEVEVLAEKVKQFRIAKSKKGYELVPNEEISPLFSGDKVKSKP